MIDPALLLKISVPPVLVAVMSLAARRWGPTFGGLIMGLPWMTGPVLFFLGLDKGPDFLAVAARGVELAVWGMGAFVLGYGFASRFASWPLSLATAIAGYAVTGLVTQQLDVPLWLAIAGAVATLFCTSWLLPRPSTQVAPGRMPSWDIPARMVATFVLVSGIMISADRLGPQRSGIIASYPVILTVIGSFTHHMAGRDAILRVLRGITLSLLAFVGFFAVVGFGAPVLGIGPAYGLAAVVALSISGGLIVWSRRRVARQPMPQAADG